MHLYNRLIDQGSEDGPDIEAWCNGSAEPGLLNYVYGADAPKNCFMLVDGTLRAEVASMFDLDVAPVAVSSLYDGKAAEQAGSSAPWLVDLSLAGKGPGGLSFHKDFFERHWPAGYSVLVLTDASLDVVRAHFRRFTRLQIVEDERRLTFRFWDPRILRPFLIRLAKDKARARRLTFTDEGTELRYLLPTLEGNPPLLVAPAPDLAQEPVRVMRLSYSDFSDIAEEKTLQRHQRMAARLRQDFAKELSDKPQEAIEAVVDHAVTHYRGFGVQSHAHLHFLAAWSVFYGVGFEKNDPKGELVPILRSDLPEKERFKAFRNRVERWAEEQRERV